MILKTIKEWEEIYGIEILDPDGFDRQDPNLHNRPINKQDFEKGLFTSTCLFSKGEPSKIIMVYKIHTEDSGWCAFDDLNKALYMLEEEIKCENYKTEFEVTYMRKDVYDNLPEFEG